MTILKNIKEHHHSFSLSVSLLPHLFPSPPLQVLQSALYTFDLIESVLARIEEIAKAKGEM